MPVEGPPTILIVDDDEDIVRMLSVFFESRGYRCLAAHSGAQGVVEFAPQDVDLVITDLNMPAGDGIALIERIRRSSSVPIVIVTAFEREYTQQRRLLRDVTTIQKPFDCYDLLDVVEVELARRKAA